MTTVCCTREMHWRNRDSILCSKLAAVYYVCVCDMTYADLRYDVWKGFIAKFEVRFKHGLRNISIR